MAEPVLGDWAPSDSGPWVTKSRDGLQHVMPGFGRKHELTTRCWCHPILNIEEPSVGHNVAQ